MTFENRVSQFAASRRRRQMESIIRLLHENVAGLTAREIGHSIGVGSPRDILLLLQREGKVTKKKHLTKHGRISFVYVLSKSHRS